MGFEDTDFEKAKNSMNQNIYNGKDRSGSQLYKQAGNSIVVDVLLHIMENLYDAMPYLFDDIQVGSFFSGIGAFEKALDKLDPDKTTKEPESAPNAELHQLGYINGVNGVANRVYDDNLARTLAAEAGGGGAKTGWYRVTAPPSSNSGCKTAEPGRKAKVIPERDYTDIGSERLQRPIESDCPEEKLIIDDTMGFDGKPRLYKKVCPSLRASRNGLKTIVSDPVGIVDPQGRVGKKCTITESCPTLRAETHGNPPCAVYEVNHYEQYG